MSERPRGERVGIGTASRYRLGACTVDRESATILRDGRAIALTPRTAVLLECLVGEAGRAVSRHALLDAAWADREVGDESLSRAISDLRQALGDTPRTPRYIETIPRVGYRLVARPIAIDASPPTHGPPSHARRGMRRAWLGALLLVATALALTLSVPRRSADAPESPAVPGGFAPLAAGPELEHSPALSHDGERLWFVAVDRYASGHVPRSAIVTLQTDGSGRALVHEREGDVITGLAVGDHGARMAFAADDGFHCRVFILDAPGEVPRPVGRCGGTGGVQRMAWADDCLVYSRFLETRQQILDAWCPAGRSGPRLPDEDDRRRFAVPLAHRADPPALLLAGADGGLAHLDLRTGALTASAAGMQVADAVFADAGHALVLTGDRGEHALTAFALPDLAVVRRDPTVPFAHFLERAAGGTSWVLGTFDWQRRLGVLDLERGTGEPASAAQRGSFHDLSVAADGSRVVFARRGPGGWRVWSLRLDGPRGTAVDPVPVSPEDRETRAGLALPGGVVHVEATGELTSRLVWTTPGENGGTRARTIPYRVTALFTGPGNRFAARCEGPAFKGICRGDDDGLAPWIADASSAAFDSVREQWYVAAGSTVSLVAESGLRPAFELPAAQSTGRWAVHDGRSYAFTRDPESATPTLVSRAVDAPDDLRTHPIDADGWNLALSADGRLFYTEQVYDSGSADLFIATTAADVP